VLSVALTGNVAAGKSTVARWFAEWGATLLDADVLVRELQKPGTAVHAAIVAHFGPGVLDDTGELRRDVLRHRILATPADRAALEAIVHPAVRDLSETRRAEARLRGDAIVVTEIPLLFETGQERAFDRVVMVDALPAVRRARLIQERGLSPETADQLMAAQLPAAAKRTASDFVLDNDTDPATLRRRARGVWSALLREAGSPA